MTTSVRVVRPRPSWSLTITALVSMSREVTTSMMSRTVSGPSRSAARETKSGASQTRRTVLELGELLGRDGHADEAEGVAALLVPDHVHGLAQRLDLRLPVLYRLPHGVDRPVVGLGRDEDAAFKGRQLGEDVVLEARLEQLEALGRDAAASTGASAVRSEGGQGVQLSRAGRSTSRAHLYDLTFRSETACWRSTYGVPLRDIDAYA